MSTRKIEGWIDGEPTMPPDPQTGFIASIMGSEANDGSSIPATLIIGNGYTEEEVQALVRDLMHSQDSADAANGIPNAVCDWAGILNKHGIKLPQTHGTDTTTATGEPFGH